MSENLHPGILLSLTSLLLITATAGATDSDKSEEVLGKDNDVVVTARLIGSATSGSAVSVKCTVKNLREEPIEIYGVRPDTSYDEDTNVVTINVGAEFPVDDGKVVWIAPGKQKEIRFVASIRPGTLESRVRAFRPLVRVNLHFLRASPNSPGIASASSIERWFENLRSVLTNSIPVRSAYRNGSSVAPASEPGDYRRRGAGH